MKGLKIFILIVAVGIISFLLFIFFHVFSPEIYNFSNRTPFDSKQWVEWNDDIGDTSLRWHMVKDLTKKYELVGMTVNEIKDLLGEPTTEYKTHLDYNLGMSGHGIDYGVLSLTVDNGIVIEYKIWHG